MAAAVAARSVLRSARTSAPRISAGAKPCATGGPGSPFRISTQKPLSHRIFRSPVEMSCAAVQLVHPFHTATASALLTSMLLGTPNGCRWTFDDS